MRGEVRKGCYTWGGKSEDKGILFLVDKIHEATKLNDVQANTQRKNIELGGMQESTFLIHFLPETWNTRWIYFRWQKVKIRDTSLRLRIEGRGGGEH